MRVMRLSTLSLTFLVIAVLAPAGIPAGAAESAAVPCEDGFAGPYPCEAVDLLAHLPNSATGGGNGNDIWGWTDPQTGREYALVGKSNGTAFVDITDPVSPVYLGRLPTATGSAGLNFRDIKVYEDHAYIVAEERLHGVQVFDLTRLRGVSAPQTFDEDGRYMLVHSAHNIAINEESGYGYVLGSGLATGSPPAIGSGACWGLHMIDLSIPTVPTFAGCGRSGYTHDAQCVIYRGPDERYRDGEICLNSTGSSLTIVDVTNKLLPEQLSRTTYPGVAYTHQGWLTEDHRYFLLGDEDDELLSGVNTTTYIFDVASLTSPQLIGIYRGRTRAIDHNQYVKGELLYQANYRAGLQILSLEDVADGQLREVGYFDIYPANDSASFTGAWSNYPYFESGNIVVNGIQQGLFVLRPRITDLSIAGSASPDPAMVGETLTYTLEVSNEGPYGATEVTVANTLPGSVTVQSVSSEVGVCEHGGGLVSCQFGDLGVGDGVTITIDVVPGQSGQLVNLAEVSGFEADHIAGNDAAETMTTVAG